MNVPNNRFKLPFFLLAAAGLVVLLITGKSVVPAAVLLAVCVVSIVVILSGRNPRWLQSPADGWEAKRRRRSN